MLTERAATFSAGGLFFRPASRIVRDLGVLALSVLATSRPSDAPPLRVLDAMAGTGVRSLRYSLEGDPTCSIHANELMSTAEELVTTRSARIWSRSPAAAT